VKRVLGGLALAVLLGGAVPAWAATLKAPASARVGGQVAVQASGLTPARYRLSLVGSARRGASCLAAIGHTRRVARQATFRGAVPRRLRCWSARGRVVATVTVRSGSFKLLVCVPRGRSGCDPHRPAARRGIRIR
jgi:hypothetical protein